MPRPNRRHLGPREREQLWELGFAAIKAGKLPDRAVLIARIDHHARHLVTRYLDSGQYMADLTAYVQAQANKAQLEQARATSWCDVVSALGAMGAAVSG